MNEAELLALIDRLYAAPLEPERWPEALHCFAQAVGGLGAVMIPLGMFGRWPLAFSPELREAAEQYEREWWQRDTGLRVCLSAAPLGS